MAMGAGIGVAATLGVSYANGINPLTGKVIQPSKSDISSWNYGDQYQLIQKHTTADITRKHYYDKIVAVSSMYGEDFYDTKVA